MHIFKNILYERHKILLEEEKQYSQICEIHQKRLKHIKILLLHKQNAIKMYENEMVEKKNSNAAERITT